MISVNGTIYIAVSHSVAYVLYWNVYVLKTFSYTVCLSLCPECIAIIFFFFFVSGCKNPVPEYLLTCITNYFTFVQKSILLSCRNYNFKFLSTLEIYFHKLKLTSCSLSHSQKICICKKIYIFGAFTLIKFQEFGFKFSWKPGILRECYFEVSVWTLF